MRNKVIDLEDNMILVDVLDAVDLILGFALSELRRCGAAVENRSISCKLGNFCKLLQISGLFLRSRRSCGNICCFF